MTKNELLLKNIKTMNKIELVNHRDECIQNGEIEMAILIGQEIQMLKPHWLVFILTLVWKTATFLGLGKLGFDQLFPR